MKISVFTGDLTDAPADAICTSTNPRLSLMMGTGGSVRDRGGFEILREAEALLAGRTLAPGTVVKTSAGRLPYKAIFHCVASDAAHRSSAATIRACVTNALSAADAAGCATLAMPVFATGHAHFKFRESLATMAAALREAKTNVREVLVVVLDADWTDDAKKLLGA